MSIWFFIWLLLSGALLYFMAWTAVIIYRQKKAWKAFAGRHKLRYKAASMMKAPELSGAFGQYTVNLFTGEHVSRDVRGSRKLTAIEIQLSSRLPVTAGIASGGMVEVVQGMNIKGELRPEHKDWNKDWVAKADNHDVLEAYLTPARLEAVVSLLKVKNAWGILVFRGDISLLRLDTPDPLDSEKKLEAILKKMTAAATVLELAAGEESRLKAVETLKPARAQSAVVISDDDIKVDLALEEEAPDEDGKGEKDQGAP